MKHFIRTPRVRECKRVLLITFRIFEQSEEFSENLCRVSSIDFLNHKNEWPIQFSSR